MITVPTKIRTVAVLPGRPCSICGTAKRGPRVNAGGQLGLVHQRCLDREPCSICKGARRGLLLNAGGDLGLVHVQCFIAWDRSAEAYEATQAFGLARCA